MRGTGSPAGEDPTQPIEAARLRRVSLRWPLKRPPCALTIGFRESRAKGPQRGGTKPGARNPMVRDATRQSRGAGARRSRAAHSTSPRPVFLAPGSTGEQYPGTIWGPHPPNHRRARGGAQRHPGETAPERSEGPR